MSEKKTTKKKSVIAKSYDIQNEDLVFKVANGAKRVYRAQMDHGPEVLKKAIDFVIARDFPEYYTFGKDFESLAKVGLPDSIRFARECKEHKLNPEIVAQHVIFMGKKVYNNVAKIGPVAALGPQMLTFTEKVYENK